MAIVRRHGKADIFLTFTCNPEWPEITRNLKPGQKPEDRPDLVDRVFRLKVKELMKDIVERHCYGRVPAYTYVIEYQKRGLPHVHLLVILQ